LSSITPEENIASLKLQINELKYAENLHHAVFKIASLSHEELKLSELYEKVHGIVNEFIDAKNFFIGLINEEEESITLSYFVDEKDFDEKDMTGFTILLGNGLSSYVVRTKKPQLLFPKDVDELIKGNEIIDVLGSSDFYCWMGAPMISADSMHGIVVVQTYDKHIIYSQQDLQFLDFVANHIAGAIESNINANQRREAQRRLAENHRHLEQNNQVLAKTVEQLKKTQEDLVQKEKMASLGGLVAGIAHEINTPLGICVTGVSHLREELKYLRSKYEKGELSEDQLVEYFDETEQGLEIIRSNANRGAELVKSFKQVAVDQSSNENRTVNILNYLQEVLLSLRPTLKRVKHEIKIECSDTLVVNINAGAISQIFSNLIMNSIIHGFEDIEKGTIQIKIDKKQNDLIIHYADNGRGIEPSKLPNLFEPFYTTKRGEGGSGLGTHLVFNLVNSSLKGNIKVESDINKGLAYLIKIPLES
jgi:signal transduction histidine kinase